MNKKVLLGFAAAFVVFVALDYIVNNVLLVSAYEETKHLWRAQEEMKWGVYLISMLFFSFFFAFIFSKGYENKGIVEGIRYGVYIGLMFMIPMAYGAYAFMPIPYSLALQWFLYGTIECIIAGIVLALIFGMKPKQAAPAA